MKAMSQAMANRCENAKNPKCDCRCGGALHGAKRLATDLIGGNTSREQFEKLPETDPHFVPSKKRAKELAKERKRERKVEERRIRAEAWQKIREPIPAQDPYAFPMF